MSDPSVPDLLERLNRLEAEADIRRLISRYFKICDDLGPQTDSDELGRLFSEDATWEGKGRYKQAFGGHRGRKAIVDMLASYCAPKPHFSMNAHYLASESITVDGDTANGKWMMLQCSTYHDDSSDLRSAALDIDFAKSGADWEIAHFRTTNIFSRQINGWNDDAEISVPKANAEGAQA